MRTFLRLTSAFAFLALGAVVTHAQPYPSRQVQIIVAYPAGGAADLIMRSVASRLTQTWGQQIVIENRAGGGTQIAADLVGKSAPDGQTLLATGMETFAISPFLYPKLSYDTKDFAPVSGLGYANQMLVVPTSSPLNSYRTCSPRHEKRRAHCSMERSASGAPATSTWYCLRAWQM